MRKEIDMKNWEGKENFEYFSKISTPHYNVAFNVDITDLVIYTQKHQISLYYSLIFLCTQSLNSINQFLLEIEDNRLFKVDRRIPCFTDLKEGATSFHMVSLPCEDDMIEFATKAKETSLDDPLPINALDGLVEPQIIYSYIPCADITMCSNVRDYNNPKLKDDTVPTIIWGKYTQNGNRCILNMTLDVNRRLIDGYSVGLFVRELEKWLFALHFSFADR